MVSADSLGRAVRDIVAASSLWCIQERRRPIAALTRMLKFFTTRNIAENKYYAMIPKKGAVSTMPLLNTDAFPHYSQLSLLTAP